MTRFAPSLRTPKAAGLLLLLLGLAAPAAVQGDQESWDAIYVGDSRVGSMHLWIKPVQDAKGRELLNVRIDYELTFRRGRDTARMRMLYGTIETQDGEVLRLDTLTQTSGQNIRTYGDVVDGKMTLILEVGDQKRQIVIPWGPDVRGPYGAELSLSREPIEPGQKRTIKTYIPDLNKVCLTRLEAADYEDVPLGPKSEPHKLLRVKSVVTDLDGKPIEGLASTLWIDAQGQLMKTKTDLLGGMYTYRTTKKGATAAIASPFELLDASILKVPQPIANSESTRDIVYRISGKGAGDLFPSDHRQTSKAESEDVAIVEVKSDGPEIGNAGSDEVAPEYLKANPLINSDSDLVQDLMRKAVGNRAKPWERAVAIEEWVFTNLKKKNFSTAFAPADEVARELSGDCTEHSVLVAALCRAAGIPARCAVGLVYAENLGGFGPHMWTEVYVNNRWVALDATFNQSRVDATHIKLSDSSLDGVAPFDAFLPVLRIFRDMKIEPLEIR